MLFMKSMDVTQFILGNYLLPFFIALLGIMLLNEKMTTTMVIGGAIIIISTLMVTVYEKQLLALFAGKNKKGLTEEDTTKEIPRPVVKY
jgi:drug/metabolite transporter (DMT)-like permease